MPLSQTVTQRSRFVTRDVVHAGCVPSPGTSRRPSLIGDWSVISGRDPVPRDAAYGAVGRRPSAPGRGDATDIVKLLQQIRPHRRGKHFELAFRVLEFVQVESGE